MIFYAKWQNFSHYLPFTFDSRTEDALVVIRINLLGAVISNTLSKKSGNVVRFHSEDRSADDLIINGLEILRFAKHNVSGTFNLPDRPCIAKVKGLRDRAVAPGENIEDFVKAFRVDAVRKILCSLYIGDFKECIVLHPVGNLFFIKFMSKQIMAVHVNLKPEWEPCGNAKIAKPEFFINEIEVIMETFALVKFQERFPGCFAVPGLVSVTAFHSGENMDQTFCGPCFRNDFLNTVVFAESMEFPDEFNFDPVFLRNFFSILTDLFCKGLGETGVIKNADTIELHISGHSFSMAPVWDISLDDHTVITGKIYHKSYRRIYL